MTVCEEFVGVAFTESGIRFLHPWLQKEIQVIHYQGGWRRRVGTINLWSYKKERGDNGTGKNFVSVFSGGKQHPKIRIFRLFDYAIKYLLFYIKVCFKISVTITIFLLILAHLI